MATLFQLPKVTGLPGSKLFFFRTGTSTPQDVYTDADLNVAHSQPVEADAAGVFAPIYLAQTDYNYRVSYYTSADALIYTVDDIPNNLGDGRELNIESVTPRLNFYDTDGPSNGKRIRFSQQGGDFTISILDDAEGVETTVFRIFRTGTNCDDIRMLADAFTVVTGGNQYDLAYSATGTFTGTLTGMASATTGTVNYRVVGNIATLWLVNEIAGTSNATGMTMTGLPAAVQPTNTKIVPCAALRDNGTSQLCGEAQITAGTITFRIARTDLTANFVTNGASSFTNSAGKGLSAGWSITYALS